MDDASFMDIYGAIFTGQRPWGRKSVTRKRERGAGPAFGGPLHGRQLSRLNWRSCCRMFGTAFVTSRILRMVRSGGRNVVYFDVL